MGTNAVEAVVVKQLEMQLAPLLMACLVLMPAISLESMKLLIAFWLEKHKRAISLPFLEFSSIWNDDDACDGDDAFYGASPLQILCCQKGSPNQKNLLPPLPQINLKIESL